MGWEPGKTLKNGYYTILSELGRGGFGVTYLASTRDGGKVVIKMPTDQLMQHPNAQKFRRDFLTEADLLSRCQHPNIVKVLELIPEAGLWGIVMEYVEGDNLHDRLSLLGVLPEVEALRYIHQVGAALEVVHGQKLLHRDLKPKNIMIRAQTKEAVLIDFGIAREFIPDLTQVHTPFQTPGYAPLEQQYGRNHWTPATDVYALAATLYHLLTGEVPPPAQYRENSILKGQGDPLEHPRVIKRTISQQVSVGVIKGMALEVKGRPATVQAWLSLLPPPPHQGSTTTTQPSSTKPTPTPPKPAPVVERVKPKVIVEPKPPAQVKTPEPKFVVPHQYTPARNRKPKQPSFKDLPFGFLLLSWLGFIFIAWIGIQATPAVHQSTYLVILMLIILITNILASWRDSLSGMNFPLYLCELFFTIASAGIKFSVSWTGAWDEAWARAGAGAGVVAVAGVLGMVAAGSGVFVIAFLGVVFYCAVGYEAIEKKFKKIHIFLTLFCVRVSALMIGWAASLIWPLKFH